MRTRQIRLGLVIFLASSVAANASAQQSAVDAAVDRGRLEQRFAAVSTLIEASSAARQVESANNPAARQRHDKAREIYREARTAFQSGQYARASALLPEASAQMFEAVRLAAPADAAAPRGRSDFEARLESVNSLLSAFRRVSAEKPGVAGVSEAGREIEALVRDAQRLSQEGQLDAGRTALDRAYLLAKAAVSSLRSGDTLVRSVHFSSLEEEYRYEVDRNDTHQMLIKILLNGKPHSTSQQSGIAKALQLRAQADAAAGRADHSSGIRLLEESTRELIRAIRSAGVFIPG